MQCTAVLAHLFALATAMQANRQWKTPPAEAASAQGRWLFGSLTSQGDIAPVDQMLPHQLRQSSSRQFDHVVLYVGANKKASKHDAMLQELKRSQVVDDVVDVRKLDLLQLAKGIMDDKASDLFTKLKRGKDYNKAMLAFIAKCLDGYDHCAWLDGDIFVHSGSLPWVDEAVQRSGEDPSLPYSRPMCGTGIGGFSSRYFVYHRQALHRMLPLKLQEGTGLSTLSGGNYKFESFFNDNLRQALREDPEELAGLQRLFDQEDTVKSTGGSWAMHPPGSKLKFASLVQACQSQGLRAMIEIIEQQPSLYAWMQKHSMENEMEAEPWLPLIKQYCERGHAANAASLQLSF